MHKCTSAADAIAASSPGDPVPMELDLSKLQSVRAFAKAFQARFTALDSLVMNAGVAWLQQLELTEDGVESYMATNHFGHFLLAELLLPMLKATAKERGVATVAWSS